MNLTIAMNHIYFDMLIIVTMVQHHGPRLHRANTNPPKATIVDARQNSIESGIPSVRVARSGVHTIPTALETLYAFAPRPSIIQKTVMERSAAAIDVATRQGPTLGQIKKPMSGEVPAPIAVLRTCTTKSAKRLTTMPQVEKQTA